MGVATSIVLFAIGAILRFATTVQTTNFDIHTIGVILMVVGAVSFVVSLLFWSSWGGWGAPRRSHSTIYREPGGRYEERSDSSF